VTITVIVLMIGVLRRGNSA